MKIDQFNLEILRTMQRDGSRPKRTGRAGAPIPKRLLAPGSESQEARRHSRPAGAA